MTYIIFSFLELLIYFYIVFAHHNVFLKNHFNTNVCMAETSVFLFNFFPPPYSTGQTKSLVKSKVKVAGTYTPPTEKHDKRVKGQTILNK